MILIKARSCDLAFLFLIKRRLPFWHIRKRTFVKKNAQFVSENLVGVKNSTKTGTVWFIARTDADGSKLMRA